MRCADMSRHSILKAFELPAIFEGTVGIHARALGAASLPLSDRFLLGQKIFRKGS